MKHPQTLYELETCLKMARRGSSARLGLFLVGALFVIWALWQLGQGVRDEVRRVEEIRKDWPEYGRE